MNARLMDGDSLSQILTIRQSDPERALEQLTHLVCELSGLPEATLLHAELVHELHGPAAALPLLEPAVPADPLAELEPLAPPELPPPDPPLWAKAKALERTKIATDAPRRFMGVLHFIEGQRHAKPCVPPILETRGRKFV